MAVALAAWELILMNDVAMSQSPVSVRWVLHLSKEQNGTGCWFLTCAVVSLRRMAAPTSYLLELLRGLNCFIHVATALYMETIWLVLNHQG